MIGDTGLWAVLFGLGGIAVVALALILMRQKANQAELWKQDPENPGPSSPHGDGDGGGPEEGSEGHGPEGSGR